jgi:DNA-binding transcriptional ArsR family regulator
MLNLRSTLRRDLLTWFKLNPSRRIWVRGLAEILDADPTNVSRELARLEGDGILKSDTEGRQLYYALNSDSPKLKPFFELLGNSIGIDAVLTGALTGIRGLESVFVYAPRKAAASTEIKLLLIGTASAARVDAALKKASGIVGRPIKHRLFSQATIQRRMTAKDPSIKDFWHVKPIALKEKS